MPSPQLVASGPAPALNGVRTRVIVLAEDDDDTRSIYGLILRHHGYQVKEARSGVEAIDFVRSLSPDLVLMDIGLPIMDGWQASRILKSDPRTSGIPIVAFSARIDSTDDLNAGAVSFDGYILKPVSPSELARRVAAYLDLLAPAIRPDARPDKFA
jgi:CheY-like chemotaxis protein